jgi:hypothetical protein
VELVSILLFEYPKSCGTLLVEVPGAVRHVAGRREGRKEGRKEELTRKIAHQTVQ